MRENMFPEIISIIEDYVGYRADQVLDCNPSPFSSRKGGDAITYATDELVRGTFRDSLKGTMIIKSISDLLVIGSDIAVCLHDYTLLIWGPPDGHEKFVLKGLFSPSDRNIGKLLFKDNTSTRKIFHSKGLVACCTGNGSLRILRKKDEKYTLIQTLGEKKINNPKIENLCFHKEKIVCFTGDRDVKIYSSTLVGGKERYFLSQKVRIPERKIPGSINVDFSRIFTHCNEIIVYGGDFSTNSLHILSEKDGKWVWDSEKEKSFEKEGTSIIDVFPFKGRVAVCYMNKDIAFFSEYLPVFRFSIKGLKGYPPKLNGQAYLAGYLSRYSNISQIVCQRIFQFSPDLMVVNYTEMPVLFKEKDGKITCVNFFAYGVKDDTTELLSTYELEIEADLAVSSYITKGLFSQSDKGMMVENLTELLAEEMRRDSTLKSIPHSNGIAIYTRDLLVNIESPWDIPGTWYGGKDLHTIFRETPKLDHGSPITKFTLYKDKLITAGRDGLVKIWKKKIEGLGVLW